MMKALHYDADGDILSVTFAECTDGSHTGLELTDNIILYIDPVARQPLTLILSGYQAMQQLHGERPFRLDRMESIPNNLRGLVLVLLQQPPLNQFLQIVESASPVDIDIRLLSVFSPMVLPSLAIS